MKVFKEFQESIKNIDYNEIITKTFYILMIILISMLVYQFTRLIVKRIFSLSFYKRKKGDSQFIKKRQKTIEKIILSLLRYFFYFVTFLIILSTIGVNVNTILTGAGILGVVFAVGSQNLMKDFVEGFFNVFEDNISVGDYVIIDGCEGNITDIGLRAIKIKSFTGEVHVIPNSKIGHLINYSLEDGKALLDVLIDYESDLDQALEVINKSLHTIKANNQNIISQPQILGVNKLQAIGYEVRIMCLTIKETHWSVQRYMRGELMKAFKNEGIKIGINQIKVIDEK